MRRYSQNPNILQGIMMGELLCKPPTEKRIAMNQTTCEKCGAGLVGTMTVDIVDVTVDEQGHVVEGWTELDQTTSFNVQCSNGHFEVEMGRALFGEENSET